MNTVAKIITGVSITAVLGAGAYSYYANDEVKAFVNPFIGVPEAVQPVETVHNACFMIFDPSGSGRSAYSVPQIDTTYVKQLIGRIRDAGTGEVWLTYIDGSARNNEVLYLAVAENPVPPVKPERTGGESVKAFSERLKQYEQDLAVYEEESSAAARRHAAEKQQFLQASQRMITEAYGPKAPGTDWSDVTGALNSAMRTLGTIGADATHYRSILLVSDAKQSMPAGAVSTPLPEIPTDIDVILVNAGGSPNHVLAGRAVEVESLARAAKKVVHGTPTMKPE